MEENIIKVYVKSDNKNVIKDINSSMFLEDTTSYIQIDEGAGDKYTHAQGNYLDKGLVDINGKCNYKLVNNKPVELTAEEKQSLFPTPALQPTTEETLSKEVANIKIDNMKKDAIITNALQTIASLKVEVMNLKGGNA
ncbi:hypothetical protein [Clostridium beijerinckii]|uniref:hypothetical protein n=1 Tax=Clostridium beijerinckii TaxID=1520 RepID=UPI000A1C7829|nr:hypothetical protein [Clostridium beijerinckii]MBA8935891.1 hypothetical protein [Clostridium beijerinckii]NRU35963.1 hypothetical protein [Clostridium beijerinckii]NSB00756.1 hypothetical protein [Clostridium beijerinckii]CUU45480.1 conserved protein of unknown function [Clostridium beijerinckii]